MTNEQIVKIETLSTPLYFFFFNSRKNNNFIIAIHSKLCLLL